MSSDEPRDSNGAAIEPIDSSDATAQSSSTVSETLSAVVLVPKRASSVPFYASLAVTGVLLATLAVLFLWPIERYIRFSPGPSPDVKTLVMVEGATSYLGDTKARLGMALVIVSPVDNLLELVRANLDDDSAVFKREEVIPPDVTDEENDEQNARLQTTSQQDATFVALDYLGYDVDVVGEGARITAVRDGTPAAGQLREKDVIKAIDGRPVRVVDDAIGIIRASPPGTAHTIELTRRQDTASTARTALIVTITTVASTEPGGEGVPIIGIQLETEAPAYDFPDDLTVTIDSGGIGGPSAGLVYSLTIIDALTPGDITGGHNVAATGTIGLDGSVGPVGGLKEKAVGVDKSGAEYFFVPRQDAASAQEGAGDMTIVPVDNLEQALAFLKTLRGGAELALPVGR